MSVFLPVLILDLLIHFFPPSLPLIQSLTHSLTHSLTPLLLFPFPSLQYYEIAKNVAPLRIKVKDMEKAQRQTEIELAELQETLRLLLLPSCSLSFSTLFSLTVCYMYY